MSPEHLEQLRMIATTGTAPFVAQATALLAGELNWSDSEIDQFIDGFMNDPYLTRN